MEDRWDCMSVQCIKEYKTLKVGSHYNIKGRGDLIKKIAKIWQ